MKKYNFFKTAIIISLLVNGAAFNANAQVTIGANEPPQATLDIIGDTANVKGNGFRLIDGNEGKGKILVSNADGVGTWTFFDQSTLFGDGINTEYVLTIERGQVFLIQIGHSGLSGTSDRTMEQISTRSHTASRLTTIFPTPSGVYLYHTYGNPVALPLHSTHILTCQRTARTVRFNGTTLMYIYQLK